MSNSVQPHRRQPTRFPVPGILQARTLEWVAISFFNAWKWKVKAKSLSCVQLSATPWTAAHQAPPSMGFSRQEYWSGVPLPSPEWVAIPFSYHLLEFALIHALSQWYYLTISSSATLFSFCLQSFPALGSFPVSQLFESGGQRIGASPSASVLLMNIQGWFPLGLTGLIFLQSIRFNHAWQPTPVFLPGESQGQRSLVGYSPWGHKESEMTEHLSTA